MIKSSKYFIAEISIFLILILASCGKKEPLYYQYKTLEFSRKPDSVQHYILALKRTRYKEINDSTIIFISITDSLKNWDSTSYRYARNKSEYDSSIYSKLDSVWSLSGRIYSSLNKNQFDFPDISERTKIIFLDPGDKNDTLYFELKKKYHNTNIYSFYYKFPGDDGDYRCYFCDSIGIIASFSGAWHNLSVLDKIINSNKLNTKLETIKSLLLLDTLFFPVPRDIISKVIYVHPPDL